MENQKEVVFSRLFDAPRERVWKAWTDPAEIAKWWGPDNVSIPECEVDLRVGGRIYIVMEAGAALGPYQGTRWPMEGTLTVVEPPSRLSYEAQAWTEGQQGAEIEQTTELTLADEGGKTRIELKVTIHKTGPKAGMAVQGMEMGFNQQLNKLGAFLAGK